MLNRKHALLAVVATGSLLPASLALAQPASQAGTGFTGGVTSSLAAPLTGYAAMPASEGLLPIWGVPGASLFGDALALPRQVARLYVAPLQQYALAEREATPGMGIVTLNGGRVGALQPISEAAAHPSLVVFSPAGNSAALYSSASGQIQALTGLPAGPGAIHDLPPVVPPGSLQSLAISDDGGEVVYADSTGAVYRSSGTGPWTAILFGSEITGLSFIPAQRDIVVCDSGSGTLQVIPNITGHSAQSLLLRGLALPPAPAFLRVSSDGRLLVVAGSGINTVLLVDLTSGQANSLTVPVPVEEMDQLSAAGAMLLSARPGEPGWMLVTDSGSAQLRFVPARPAAPARTDELLNGASR